jgi:hypothetical protein
MHTALLFVFLEIEFMIDASKQPEVDVVGEEFGGKWIAWDEQNIHIVASGITANEAKQNALGAGVSEPTLEFVPPSDAAFLGGI